MRRCFMKDPPSPVAWQNDGGASPENIYGNSLDLPSWLPGVPSVASTSLVADSVTKMSVEELQEPFVSLVEILISSFYLKGPGLCEQDKHNTALKQYLCRYKRLGSRNYAYNARK